MTQIRILIVEDEPLIAEDIREILSNIDFTVSGIAYDALDALKELRSNTPDVVLLDINLSSEKDGIDIATIINQEYKIPFVYLTSYADRTTLERAKHTRPMGYIVKPFDEKDLYASLEIAMHNFYLAQPVVDLNVDQINQRFNTSLTQKEFEILQSIMTGKTNRQMAEQHFVSVNTIKTHLKNLYEKLDVHTRSKVIAKLRGSLPP